MNDTSHDRLLTVQVRYCGGCNPDIDRKAVVDRLKKLAASEGALIRFAAAGQPADVHILVNGCAHACLEEEGAGEAASFCVSVQGENVDRRPAPEQRLPEVLWQKISKLMDEWPRDRYLEGEK